MRYQGWLDDEGVRTNLALVILVFVAVMVSLGAAAWFTKGVDYMPPPGPGSLAAPPPTNEPPTSR
jgi:hypothetical protein